MKIALIAPGSRGDVQPYVALGKGLKDAGHSASIVAYGDFQDLVTRQGLEFVDLGGSIEAVARGQQDMLAQGQVLKMLAGMGKIARQQAHRAAANGLAACQDADLIVAGLAGLFVGLALSERLGVPFVPAHLLPITPTDEFASILTPLPKSRVTAWANGLTHRAAQQMIWQMYRSADTQARVRVLNLPPAPFWGPFAGLQRPGCTALYGYSRHVLPRPGDWDDSIHVTGYWFLDPPAGWDPPGDLVAFLDAGPPPVYIGFGSMMNKKPEETANVVLQALARTGQRGVLYAGWGGLKKDDLPANVFMTRSTPHTWLLPKMAVVVHHGGAGTTAAGVRAGVPSIITPFFGDQPFWGRRIHELGVGPRPIPNGRLTVDNLAEAIQQAVTDSAMRDRAADLGRRIRAEDGVGAAVAVIEQLMPSSAAHRSTTSARLRL
jgi:sterol 3beta-glucosyltransferase